MRLVACEGCARHVRTDEELCPFCGAGVIAPTQALRPLPGRLGRAAMFVAGAAVVAATATACGGTPLYGAPPEDAGMVDAGPGAAPAYGAPPADAGPDDDAG